MKIEIKHRCSGKVLFSFETDKIKIALEAAFKSGANLSGASLSRADLYGANLYGAHLYGAKIDNIIIKKAMVIHGLYKYLTMPIIAEDGKYYIKLGCHLRSVEEWENDFWNNNNEFPDDGSIKSHLRVLAFETAKKWLEINKWPRRNLIIYLIQGIG